MLYLGNSVAYDHGFWDTCVKWWYLEEFFKIFFKSLIFWVVSGVKGQKMAQNDKNSVCHTSYLRNHTLMWNDDISGCLFNFFKTFCKIFSFLIFQVVRRVKGQKTTQNDEKLCFSCLISQEPYIIWSLFMVHMWIRIISPGFFYIYFKFLFLWVNIEVKGQKMSQNDKKLCLSYSISQEAYIIWLWFLVRMIFRYFFHFFFYFDFVGC